jgi:hypothetical protein
MLVVPEGISSAFPAGKDFAPRQISEAAGSLGYAEPGRGLSEVHGGASEWSFVRSGCDSSFYASNQRERTGVTDDQDKIASAKTHIDHYGRSRLPTFEEIREWSWRLNEGGGNIAQAAEHFDCPPSMIRNLVDEMGEYPYFGYSGEDVDGSKMKFWHDGE